MIMKFQFVTSIGVPGQNASETFVKTVAVNDISISSARGGAGKFKR